MAANFNGFWQRLCVSNPGLSDESTKMNISVAALKTLLDKAYRQGSEDTGKAADDFANVGKSPLDPILDQFGKMFGTK